MTRLIGTIVGALVVGLSAGCSSRTDLEQVPIGTRVEVTREDGGVVTGTLTARDDRNVRMAVGRASRSIPRAEIANVEVVDGVNPARLPAAARFREFTVPEDTALRARLEGPLGSDTSRVEDAVVATLTEAVDVDGVVVFPRGSILNGVVTNAQPAGNVSGNASLAMRFRSLSAPGQTVPSTISAGIGHTAESTTRTDAKKIGIPAAAGAVIGAIVGGKKGAGIGAVIGGGAGAVVVLTSSGPEVRYPNGANVVLSLDQDVQVRVPLRSGGRP